MLDLLRACKFANAGRLYKFNNPFFFLNHAAITHGNVGWLAGHFLHRVFSGAIFSLAG